jgi:hypothetical protein
MASNTPEEADAGMQAWMDWGAKTGDALVDFGTPLGVGKEVSPSTVSNTTTNVVGYSVVQAESLNAAVEAVKDHPHLMNPGSPTIQVYEALDLPGA